MIVAINKVRPTPSFKMTVIAPLLTPSSCDSRIPTRRSSRSLTLDWSRTCMTPCRS